MALPKPADSESAEDLSPFLKASDIGRVGTIATVKALGARDEVIKSEFGPQIVIEIKHKGRDFDFAVKLDTPNYRYLYKRFGAKGKNWKGPIKLEVLQPIKKGYRPYIGVVRD